MKEDRIYKAAKKRMLLKKGFYKHLSTYIAVGIFFIGLNGFTYFNEEPEIWFHIPMMGWGIGIMIHYFSVFGLPGTNILTQEWEENEIEREVWRMRGGVQLPSGEPEKDELELKEMQKNWKDGDLV